MRGGDAGPNNWRDYQEILRRNAKQRYLIRRLPRLGLYGGTAFLMLLVIFYAGSWLFAFLGHDYQPPLPEEKEKKKKDTWPENLTKKDLPDFLNHLNLDFPPETGNYFLVKKGVKFTVETFLDTTLHNYILNLLRRSLTYQAAVVVLRPDNGQVLAMVNYKKNDYGGKENLCIKAAFPAASLFKIISAAAAIEAHGFTPDSTVVFRGRKHTLYRSQLKKSKGRYTNKTSLKKAFSGSINPVFGKIGIYSLGRKWMSEYAGKFLFNRDIPFDLPLDTSNIFIPEDDFGLAEIASGFNKQTIISPLHAALITAAVANNGVMMEPALVKRIMDESGEVFYSATFKTLVRPIKETTSKKMKILMGDTVINGTCRKAFRPLLRNKLFKEINLGAKTGTINDELDQYKYDWLTAYALPNNGESGICITVLAVHGKKLGVRSKDLARYIIKYRFTSKNRIKSITRPAG